MKGGPNTTKSGGAKAGNPAMGSLQSPTAEQYARLKSTGQLNLLHFRLYLSCGWNSEVA